MAAVLSDRILIWHRHDERAAAGSTDKDSPEDCLYVDQRSLRSASVLLKPTGSVASTVPGPSKMSTDGTQGLSGEVRGARGEYLR